MSERIAENVAILRDTFRSENHFNRAAVRLPRAATKIATICPTSRTPSPNYIANIPGRVHTMLA
jgi:hypothetical protein